MKKILFIITCTVVFYSCETSTSPQRNPIGYLSEDAYFITDPFISYPNITNRIDVGQIQYLNSAENDSNFVRAMFYDNSVLFKNAGDIYVNNKLIDKLRADKILKIKVLFEDIIDFGPGYYSELSSSVISDSILIEATGSDEVSEFTYKFLPVRENLIISNINQIKNITINEGFEVVLDSLKYENYRVYLFNDKARRATFFQNPNSTKLFVPKERLSGLNAGSYTLEITAGRYIIDTLDNQNLIINNFKSFRFDVELK